MCGFHEERERGRAHDRERDADHLQSDAAREQVVVVDDGADAGGHRRAKQRRDHHRPNHGGRRVQQQSRGRDDGADEREHGVRHAVGREVSGARDQLLAGDVVVGGVGVGAVARVQFVEAPGDDRFSVHDDGVGVL